MINNTLQIQDEYGLITVEIYLDDNFKPVKLLDNWFTLKIGNCESWDNQEYIDKLYLDLKSKNYTSDNFLSLLIDINSIDSPHISDKEYFVKKTKKILKGAYKFIKLKANKTNLW